jgi:hypothetical protein
MSPSRTVVGYFNADVSVLGLHVYSTDFTADMVAARQKPPFLLSLLIFVD